jgi:DNA-binding response OmpR family regulator
LLKVPSMNTTTHPHVYAPTIANAHVLLAEDDLELRSMLASALRSDGYDVTEVADGGRLLVEIGSAYLDGVPTDAFDLLISDVRMPVCGGLSILEGLRQARWDTPAIVMSAFGDSATRDRARALGAAYFDKPFDVDDVRTAVVFMLQYGRVPVDSGRGSRG